MSDPQLQRSDLKREGRRWGFAQPSSISWTDSSSCVAQDVFLLFVFGLFFFVFFHLISVPGKRLFKNQHTNKTFENTVLGRALSPLIIDMYSCQRSLMCIFHTSLSVFKSRAERIATSWNKAITVTLWRVHCFFCHCQLFGALSSGRT